MSEKVCVWLSATTVRIPKCEEAPRVRSKVVRPVVRVLVLIIAGLVVIIFDIIIIRSLLTLHLHTLFSGKTWRAKLF